MRMNEKTLMTVAGIVGAVGVLGIIWRLARGGGDERSWLEKRIEMRRQPKMISDENMDYIHKLVMDVARAAIVAGATAWVGKKLTGKSASGGYEYEPVGARGYMSMREQIPQILMKALMGRMRQY